MEGIVKFGDEKLKEAFENLKNFDRELYDQIDKATDEISRNVFCGRNVKKKLIPKELVHKHGLDNLWIYIFSKKLMSLLLNGFGLVFWLFFSLNILNIF